MSEYLVSWNVSGSGDFDLSEEDFENLTDDEIEDMITDMIHQEVMEYNLTISSNIANILEERRKNN